MRIMPYMQYFSEMNIDDDDDVVVDDDDDDEKKLES